MILQRFQVRWTIHTAHIKRVAYAYKSIALLARCSLEIIVRQKWNATQTKYLQYVFKHAQSKHPIKYLRISKLVSATSFKAFCIGFD